MKSFTSAVKLGKAEKSSRRKVKLLMSLERAHAEIHRLQSVLTTAIEIVAEIKEIEQNSTGDRTRAEALQVALNLLGAPIRARKL